MPVVLRKVAKVVCAYCGQPKPQATLEIISNCEHCGALSNRVTVITVNKKFDKQLNTRQPFADEEERRVQPL